MKMDFHTNSYLPIQRLHYGLYQFIKGRMPGELKFSIEVINI